MDLFIAGSKPINKHIYKMIQPGTRIPFVFLHCKTGTNFIVGTISGNLR